MDERELQAAVAWSSLPFLGDRSFQALVDHAREARRSLAELWEAPPEDLRAFVPLHQKAAAALAEDAPGRWRQAEEEAATIRSRGADLLLSLDPDFPEALARTARRWPMLFAYGALALLEEPRVAIVNSRSPSHAALAATDALADALARRDVVLVTSTNREAYKAAAVAAKRHAGPAVMVLDRGIAEAFPAGLEREPVAAARVWDESFDPELQLLLSPFGWREHWNPRSGRKRDALIFDLAEVVVAMDIRPGGIMERECRAVIRNGRKLIPVVQASQPEAARRVWDEIEIPSHHW
ncbi:MAG TPA: DNA-processing protein DprA, partial [Armatimonadota bacterium]|nr:DNA-processing protein DprA [Armatimonadota bacterium]